MRGIKRKVIGLIIIVITIISILPLRVLGSSKDELINFKRITTEDGLSQTTVEYMYKDKQGYIWIGTNDGLNRYNGRKFEIYRYREDMPNSISGNFVPAITEDNKGNLWVGTSSGLNKIHLETNEIKVYNAGKEFGMLASGNVTEVFVNKEGNVYIATTNGLYLYNEKNDNFTRIYYSSDVKESITDQFVYSVTEDSNGDLWVGTDDGLNKIVKETSEIIKFYKDDSENSLSDKLIYKINSQDEGYIWIGTYEGGLIRLDINTYEMKTYRADTNNKKALQSDFIRFILRDSRGNLWVATTNGLSKLDEAKGEFITYQSKIYDEQSLISNDVRSLMEDSSGAIWIGTYEGISMFNTNNYFKLHKHDPFDESSISENMIAGIYEDKDNLLWIGTVHSGINVLNRDTGEILKLKSYDLENSIAHNEIRDITGIDNEIWIATAEGLSMYNKETKKITNYTNNKDDINSLSHNDVRALYIDSEGLLWIGTRYSLSTFNRKSGEFTTVEKLFPTKSNFAHMITDIVEDNEGNMWFACGLDSGIFMFNKKTGEFKNYINIKDDDSSLSFNSTRTIAIDNDGEVWIGTQYGLNKFNKKDGTFTRYTEKEGLSNNFIYGILVDENNNLWISTNNGLSKFDSENEKFMSFNVNDGLQANEFNGYSYFKSESGEMFFGGIKGLSTFDPKDIKTNTFNTPVTIDNIINSENEILDYNNIFLDYKENNIQFDFFLPYYINKGSVQYAYMLEGLDKDWIFSENRNYANYTNLESGNYKFKVMGKTVNGDWTAPTVINFEVEIKPWETPFAYLVYSLILVSIILVVWNRVKILNMLVEQKTSKLEEVYEENRKLDKKLIENMKYKNNYFLNLSHELRTPLNVILSSYQLINKLTEEGKDIPKEKMKSYMYSIKKNADRLLNLISNIIDTSKVESGNYKLNIKEVDIIYEVEEIALSMKDLIEEREIELIIDPEIEEKIIQCDMVEMEKCIINLIGNAIKFTKPGGTIRISMSDLDDKVKISIKDNGVGISKEYHETIFNRFGQAYNNITEEYGGSGLGLTLTKQLIDIHRGEIKVKSEVGVGSEFVIILPVKHSGNN